MKKIFLAIASVLIFNSCALIPKLYEIPATDFMLIHKNPKVGDYALYNINGGVLQKKFEVMKVDGDEITIRYIVIYPNKEVESPELYYRVLNREGKVLRAWMMDGEKRYETPVAIKDETHSFEKLTFVKKPYAKPVTTAAGEFKIDGAYNYVYNLDLNLASSQSTHFDVISYKVPFLLVRGEIVATSKTGPFLKTMEVIVNGGEAILKQDYLSLYDELNPDIDAQHIRNDLIEYGFGSK